MNEFYKIIREKKKYDRTWILAWALMVGALAVSLHPRYYTGKGTAISLMVIASMEFFRKYIYFFYEKRVIWGSNLPGKNDADIYKVMRNHAFDADGYFDLLLKKLMKLTGLTFVGMLIYSLIMCYRFDQFPITFLLMSIFLIVIPLIVAAGYKNEARMRFHGKNEGVRKHIGGVGTIIYLLCKYYALYFGTLSMVQYLSDKVRCLVILKGLGKIDGLVFVEEELNYIAALFFGLWGFFFIAKNLYLGVRRILLGLAVGCLIVSIVADAGNNIVYDGETIAITENFKTYKYDIDDIVYCKKSYNNSHDVWDLYLKFSDGKRDVLFSRDVVNKTCIDAVVTDFYDIKFDYKYKNSKMVMKELVDKVKNKGEKND